MSTNHKTTSRNLLELRGDNALHNAVDYIAPSYTHYQILRSNPTRKAAGS